MKLRTKLTTLLLLCGIAPMTISVSLAWFSGKDTTEKLVAEASDALRVAAEDELKGQVAGRGRHVRSYFETIEQHARSMAVDEGIWEAMQAFRTGFAEFATAAAADPAKQATLQQQLASYYRNDFAAEYRRQNDGKAPAIDAMLASADELMVAAQHYYVQSNPHPLGQKHRLDSATDGTSYATAHAKYHPWLREFQQTFGYYDVFLIDASGRVVYSVFKELDFGTSLTNGPWRDTSLGDLFSKLQTTPNGGYAFSDFACYAPSYEAPAAFLGSPVSHGTERAGYIAFQMPIDRINAIMTKTEGLGETGEIVLVGPDRRMRSDSRHEPEKLSVDGSFRRPETGKLDLPPVALAIDKGESGMQEIVDVDGGEELCVYAPLDVLGNRWCVLGKVEKGEVFAEQAHMNRIGQEAETSMLYWNLGLVLTTSLVVALIAWWFSRQLTAPIHGTVSALKDIAEGEGDLTRRLDENRPDELGELGKWFNRFLSRLQETIKNLGQKAQGVTSASTQLMATAASLATGADRTKAQSTQVAAAAEQMTANMNSVSTSSDAMAGTLRTVAAAVEQMTASIGEVAKSADGAARVATQAADLTRTSNEKISLLGAAANEIGRVIETIQDIAEQTNLLALNATIEAARAGEAGKGFSVVANEVKDLARQTAEATQDIRQRIERIQSSTQESVDAIVAIDKVIAQVSAASQSIATSVGEQRTATQEIAQNLAANTRTVEVVNRNVAECVTTSQEISRSIQEVDQNARSTASGADETEQAGKGLGSLAHELQEIVLQFRV
ncbi:MAG: methyl-accepting chemotaxis protein [Planctomycetes bacterium]|nr:methyl-accepting chemotaxis protein [Planctomycetota bacterium]